MSFTTGALYFSDKFSPQRHTQHQVFWGFPSEYFSFLRFFTFYLFGCSTWDLWSSLQHADLFFKSWLNWPGVEPRPRARGVWSLSLWTAREIPLFGDFYLYHFKVAIIVQGIIMYPLLRYCLHFADVYYHSHSLPFFLSITHTHITHSYTHICIYFLIWAIFWDFLEAWLIDNII